MASNAKKPKMMKTIKLKSSDGVIYEVDSEAFAKYSETIREMIELSHDDDDDDEPLVLSRIESSVLKLVIDWVIQHKDDPEDDKNDAKDDKDDAEDDKGDAEDDKGDAEDDKGDAEDDKNQIKMTPWDAEFFKVDSPVLLKLCNAADFLGMKRLLLLSAQVIRNILKKGDRNEIVAMCCF